MGVTSLIIVTSRPTACRARIAASRPWPGPLTKTSTCLLYTSQARQLVSHAHFTVNGKKVNIPSYLVKAGDVIEVAESSRSSEVFKRLMGQDAPVFLVPTWMERDKNSLKGTVVRLPVREEIDVPVEEHLIVESVSYTHLSKLALIPRDLNGQ